MSHERRSTSTLNQSEEDNLFLDVLHEAPLSGLRQPTSILGSIMYCLLLAGYATLAVAEPWLFHPISGLAPSLLCSCNVLLLVITGMFQQYLVYQVKKVRVQLGHGDYSSANTKILRMVNTFAVDNETRHMIETLQTQLQKAQEKLRAIEDLKGQTDAGNDIESDLSEVNARLRGEIATLNKREERYKAVFYEKILVFRKACCSLFGYKIVMVEHQRPNGIPVTRFTLQSAYAQNDDEILEFEYESGVTNILVNEYTSRPEISHQVEIFIHKMNSLAAFTANLTIESFNRQTLS